MLGLQWRGWGTWECISEGVGLEEWETYRRVEGGVGWLLVARGWGVLSRGALGWGVLSRWGPG